MRGSLTSRVASSARVLCFLSLFLTATFMDVSEAASIRQQNKSSPVVAAHLGKAALVSVVSRLFGGIQSREWDQLLHSFISSAANRVWEASPHLHTTEAATFLMQLDSTTAREDMRPHVDKFKAKVLNVVKSLADSIQPGDRSAEIFAHMKHFAENGKMSKTESARESLSPEVLVDMSQSTQVCSSDGQSLTYSDGCTISCTSGQYASQCYLESMDFVGDEIVSTFHTECTSCPSGYYSFGFSSGRTRTCDYCSACSTGTYSSAGSSVCSTCSTTCPAGSSLTTTTCPSTSQDTQCECSAGYAQVKSVSGTLTSVSGTWGSSSGVQCQACVAGSTYASTARSASCTTCSTCPSPSTIVAAACTTTTNTQCQCAPGYAGASGAFGASSQTCTACAAGTYQPQSGQLSCVSCPANSFSTIGATSCTCNQGYSGSSCTACGASTYMDTVGGTCLTCPSLSNHALSAQTSVTSCQCPAGTFGAITSSSSVCTSCPQGFYQSSPGQSSCTQCPAHSSTSSTGATSSSQCLCDAGYTASAGSCVACGAGTYKTATLSNDGCTACPSHATSDEGSTSLAACVCAVGYTGVASVNGCTQCSAGTFKTVTGSGACSVCSVAHMASTSSSTSDCACDKGYSGDSSSCTACAFSYYKDTISAGSCTACGPHMTTASTASTSSSACICTVGYAGSGSCSACLSSEGKYQDEQGQTDCKTCTACPSHSTETSSCGGTSNRRCRCNGHYVRSDGVAGAFDAGSGVTCSACSSSQFAVAGDASCQACSSSCPSHSSKSGDCSDTADMQCECSAGYYGTSAGSFTATADNSCTGCPSGYHASSTGSQSCDPCELNTYASGVGSASCTACPDHSTTSTTGKRSSSDCICDAGYVADDSSSVRVCKPAIVSTPTPTPTPSSDGPTLLWWHWLLIALGAVIVVIIIVGMVRFKTSQAQPQPQPSFIDANLFYPVVPGPQQPQVMGQQPPRNEPYGGSHSDSDDINAWMNYQVAPYDVGAAEQIRPASPVRR